MKEFFPFRLDPVNQCLWRRTESGEYERILLTPTEFGVLDHLVEHAGQLVTHRQLLDAVWPRTVIEPQAVKSKVFHLRRALDDDPRQPRYIETVSRRGYRFVAKLADVAVSDRPTPQPVPAAEARLVGRATDLAGLWQCVRNASTGKLEIVFITGEPGIGKTALVEELGRQVTATQPEIRIAHGQCVEGFGSKEAFYPVLQAIGQLCRGPLGASVVDTLASHAPTWLVQFPALLTREHRETLQQEILGATRERMLREICEALETIARTTPLLLVLEDLHWADSSTLDLISALARHRLAAKALVVATYRPTDVARSSQPLHALKRDLVARHLSREIVLEPLAESEIAQYLTLGDTTGGVPEALASLLHRHTEGNPLFMIAVLEHLIGRGLVERDRDGWGLRRPAEEISLELPESLRQMIGAQIERLTEADQRVLEVAAIAGLSFAPAIGALSADMDPGPFEECCDALARRRHILRLAGTQELPEGRIVQRYEFTHALYREALYERQSPARRAMLHRRRAERLEEIFAASLDDVAPEVAHHFEKGADWARAVKYLRRAADVAARRGALEGARANLQHALALADRLSVSERVVAETEVLYSLAGIYLATLDARVVDTLTLLRERAAEYGLVDVEVKALVDLAYPLAWSGSKQAIEVIDRALRLSDAQRDPLVRARTRARCMVRRLMVRGWNPDDAEESRRAMAEIRRLGTKEDVAWHLIDSGFVEVTSSHYGQAQRDAVDSLTLLRAVHDESIPLGYIAARRLREYIAPWSLTFLGEWGAARREFDASIALAERNADSFGSGVLLLLRCWLQLFAMDFAGARSVCASIMAAREPPGGMFGRHLCLTLSGAAEAGLANNDLARERLLAARSEMDRGVALLDWYSRLWQRWALTNLWLSTGDLTHAREETDLFVANAGATEERTWQALAWDAHARTGLASGDLPGAQDSIGRALTVIEGFEAPVAAWQAHATAAAVARVRRDAAAATHHRQASRDIVLRLAASLGADEAWRRTFLAAPAVAAVLREE